MHQICSTVPSFLSNRYSVADIVRRTCREVLKTAFRALLANENHAQIANEERTQRNNDKLLQHAGSQRLHLYCPLANEVENIDREQV